MSTVKRLPSAVKQRWNGFQNPVAIRSIKEQVILPFADCVEQAALASEPEARERRMKAVRGYRGKYYEGGDYVVVRAVKPREGGES